MLKQWVADPSLSSITVEERYHTFVENLRTDRYVTVTFSNMFFLRSGLMFMLTKRVPEQLVYRLDALKTCIIHRPPLAQVTLFQLEKIYGKSSDAKAFIKELCRGSLAKSSVAKSKHIIYMHVQLTIICL